jgi:hypothetical protein
MSLRIEVAGRRAREALATGGEVCAVFRRSFYLRSPRGCFACVGDQSLGRGPLNALASGFAMPSLGETVQVSLESCRTWQAPVKLLSLDPELLREARLPEDGLACLIAGRSNPLALHARPALDALDRWLAGDSLSGEAETLIGLGPGLTPSGDDYLGGMLVALQMLGHAEQAGFLWRWLEPRLAARTSAISAAHLAGAADGEAHEALHAVLSGDTDFARLDAVGHCSAWDALAGAVAVIRRLTPQTQRRGRSMAQR